MLLFFVFWDLLILQYDATRILENKCASKILCKCLPPNGIYLIFFMWWIYDIAYRGSLRQSTLYQWYMSTIKIFLCQFVEMILCTGKFHQWLTNNSCSLKLCKNSVKKNSTSLFLHSVLNSQYHFNSLWFLMNNIF